MKLYRKILVLILVGGLFIFLNGCGKSNKKPVPKFSLSPNQGQAPLEVSLDASASKDKDGEITTHKWTFGDGSSGEGKTITHTYKDAGKYEVTLTITDNKNGEKSLIKTVTVENAPPTAKIVAEPSKGPAPLKVSFDLAQSNDPNGTIDSYVLKFGDGEQKTGSDILSKVTHKYSQLGTYEVKLSVTDDDGSTSTISKTIKVVKPPSDPPVARINVEQRQQRAPVEVTFSATDSRDPDGNIVNYEWFLRDESIGTGSKLTYKFQSGGQYAIRLLVTDNNGKTSTTTQTISIKPPYNPVGAVADNGYIELQLRSLEVEEKIGGQTPRAGHQFIVLNVKATALKNNQYPSKSMYFQILDDEGNSYSISLATAQLDNYFKSSVLEEGESTKGMMVFEVPTDPKYYILSYDQPDQPAIKYKFSI